MFEGGGLLTCRQVLPTSGSPAPGVGHHKGPRGDLPSFDLRPPSTLPGPLLPGTLNSAVTAAPLQKEGHIVMLWFQWTTFGD